MADYLPKREAELVNFSTNFNARANALNVAIGLTVAQCSAYTVLHDSFVASYNLVQGGENSTPNIVAKNQAKADLIRGEGGIRELVRLIQAFPGTTDVQRAELLINIPDVEPSPVPVPAFAPSVSVVSSTGRTVRIALRDSQEPARRGRPLGVIGATVITCISEEEPTPSSNWRLQGNTGSMKMDITFPESTAAGTKVWIAASWFNPSKESGPMSTPLATHLPGGAAAQVA
jgi:hypothetical protein